MDTRVSKLWGLSMRTETRLDVESKPVVIGDYSQISSIVKAGGVDRIIVALDERRGKFPLEQLLFCRLKGIRVDDGIAFTEQLAGKLSVENLHPSFLIFSDGFKRSAIFKKLKRGFDIIGSLLGLTFFAPVMSDHLDRYQTGFKGPNSLPARESRGRWKNISSS